jgi:hypothetical protein
MEVALLKSIYFSFAADGISIAIPRAVLDGVSPAWNQTGGDEIATREI